MQRARWRNKESVMKRFVKAVVGFVGAGLLAMSASAATPSFNPDAEYSATRVVMASGERFEQRIYQKGMKVSRTEMNSSEGSMIMIMRLDQNKTLMLMPDQGMYMEVGMNDPRANAVPIPEIPDTSDYVDTESLGTENVNGVDAEKWRVKARNPDNGKTVEMLMWLSDDGIPVRFQSEEGGESVTMELKDLQVGTQDLSLFVPPSNLRKFEMPAGLGNMFGGKSPF